jgi:hypothetical protein
MLKSLKINLSSFKINVVSRFPIAISTALLVATPARANVAGDEIFLPQCVAVTNLEKHPKYQIIARVSSARPNDSKDDKDYIMNPGSCVSVSYTYTISLYAIDKSTAGTSKPIPGDITIPYYYYTRDSELPWYVSDVRDELQIIEVAANKLTLKRKTMFATKDI